MKSIKCFQDLGGLHRSFGVPEELSGDRKEDSIKSKKNFINSSSLMNEAVLYDYSTPKVLIMVDRAN
jgi:hypothetical protein